MEESAQLFKKIKQILSLDKIGAVHVLNKLNHRYNKNRLELPIAQVYNELKIKNIRISNDMQFEIEQYLLSARFTMKRDANGKRRIAMSDVELIKRIALIENCIQTLKETYSGQKDIDEAFILTTRFLATNVRLLKRQKQVKHTFTKLPWEEIEFCLSIFIISALNLSQVLYRLILDKEKMLKFLGCFLTELKKTFAGSDNEKLGNLNRSDVVYCVIQNNSDFKELYDVYNMIKNVYSLTRIESYLKVAMTVSVENDGIMGKLVLERTLQVIGEYLKNTVDSPNVSENIHHLLYLSAPRELKNIITFLRNSLSHAPSLKKRMELETNQNKQDFFFAISNDLKKLEKECVSIHYNQRVQILFKFMHKPDHSVMDDLIRELEFVEKATVLYSSTEYEEIWSLVQLLKEKFNNKTEYDIYLFDYIESIMKSEGAKATDMKLYHLKMTSQIFGCEYDPSLNLEILKNELSKNMSDTIFQGTRMDYQALLGWLYKLYDRIKETKPNSSSTLELDIIFEKLLSFMLEERRVNAVTKISDNIKKSETVNDKAIKTKQLQAVLEDIESNLTLESDRALLRNTLEPKWNINRTCMEIFNLIAGIDKLEPVVKQNIKTLLQDFGLKAKEKQRIYSFLDTNDFENLKSEINKRNSFEPLFKKVEDFNLFSYEKDMMNVRDFVCSLKFKADCKTKIVIAIDTLVQKNNEIITKHFIRRLNQLQELVKVNNILNDKKAFLASEMLMLDITEVLENLALLADNNFFLEVTSPTLTGKVLRNFLAHGDVLVDALGINIHYALIANINQLLKIGNRLLLQDDILLGQSIYPDIDRAKHRYDDELMMVTNQFAMFEAMEDGDNEKVLQCIENGADVLASSTAGWSWAHFIARGGHLEMFKQFCEKGNSYDATSKINENKF